MPDSAADFDTLLDSFRQLREEGLVGEIGLSTVSLEQLDHALGAGVEVATVSNPFGPGARADDAVVARCEERGIAFLPYFSLVTSQQVGALRTVADEIGATSSQVAIAWQLQHSPVLVPIPGTSKLDHLHENVAAAAITLTDEQRAAIG